MPTSTLGPPVWKPPPSGERSAVVYWRRRLGALVVGMSVLAVVAWAFEGVLGGGPVQPPAATAATSSRSPTISPSATSHVSQPAQPVPGRTVSPGQRGAALGPLPHCPPNGVVLSLFTTSQSYGPGKFPVFQVDVVSVRKGSCKFNVGAQHIVLEIRAGSTTIWTSADCMRGTGSLTTNLAQGVPTVLPISWDLRAASDGCPAPASEVPPGNYTARATDGSLVSNLERFRIQ
jgi:hypothetical protein